MKRLSKVKVISIILVACVLIFLNACGDSKDKDTTTNKDVEIQSGENKDSDSSNKSENNDNKGNSENTDDSDDSDKEKNDGASKETFLDANNIVTNTDSIEVVVNKQRNLAEDYIPSDLVKITDVPTVLENPEVNQLRAEAAEALTKLINEAKQELGIQIYARSGYRSYNTQVSLYDSYVKNHGQAEADTFSAKPGQSEHQTGLAMDVTSEDVNYQLTEDFGDTEEGKWLCDNAYKYGFIVRYPKGKESITGYMYEPWHIRYLGTDLAKKVYDSGLTLDEYMFGE